MRPLSPTKQLGTEKIAGQQVPAIAAYTHVHRRTASGARSAAGTPWRSLSQRSSLAQLLLAYPACVRALVLSKALAPLRVEAARPSGPASQTGLRLRRNCVEKAFSFVITKKKIPSTLTRK